jgi:predicted site-specific integrase-resolvase
MSPTLDLVGLAEVAKILRVPPNTARSYRRRGKLPPPITELACGPIWHRKDIEKLRGSFST